MTEGAPNRTACVMEYDGLNVCVYKNGHFDYYVEIRFPGLAAVTKEQEAEFRRILALGIRAFNAGRPR